MQRTSLIRVVIGAYSESTFGLSVNNNFGDPKPERVKLHALSGGPDVSEDQWIEPDGNRVLGWRVKAPISTSGKVAFSTTHMVCGEISWNGDGDEMVTATVSAPYRSNAGFIQVGILRDPTLLPWQVKFFARGEHSGYIDMTGRLHDPVHLPTPGVVPHADMLGFNCVYSANGTPDDSPMSTKHPYRLWAWTMKNDGEFHAKVGRITAFNRARRGI